MSQFETIVQQEIYEALTNAIDGLDVPVYDSVPQVNSGSYTAFPYVTIGEDVITDMSTDTELINLVSITIHTWSRYSGKSEVKRIQGEIYSLLNRRRINNPDYKFININQVTSQSQLESDGETRHGIQTFNLIIEEL